MPPRESERPSAFPPKRPIPWPSPLFPRAELDLLSIGEYILCIWGATQANRYLGELDACCHCLADKPLLSCHCDEIRAGLRRMEQGCHVILCPGKPGGILISRILHQSMVPNQRPIDDRS